MHVSAPILLPLIAIGVPASIFRLWWIWWQSVCNGCGLFHRTCECPPSDHTMRPRKRK